MSKIIDARGRSCPEPVIMARNALRSGEGDWEVLVDNPAAAENVSRFAGNAGYPVEIRDGEELYRVRIGPKVKG